MMDYYSAFPAPSKDAAVAYVVRELYPEFETYAICENDIRSIASAEYDAFGSLGSQAAWLTITSKLLVRNTRNRVHTLFATNTM